MSKLPKAPEHDINYGIIPGECEKKFIEWIKTLISLPDTDKDEIARTIYYEVCSLGYLEGYDSCCYDHNLC